MGWKSTANISRKEAIQLIFARMSDVHQMSDQELDDMLVTLGYGDNINLPYYGNNFIVTHKDDPCDGCHNVGTEYCAHSCKEI